MPEDTLLVYHTLHVPHQSADLGMWENDPFLSQHVKQLNAAGRHVAQSLHYHVIDIEAMAAQVSKGTLLVDNTHPGPDFMMQARNLLFYSPLSPHHLLTDLCTIRHILMQQAATSCSPRTALSPEGKERAAQIFQRRLLVDASH